MSIPYKLFSRLCSSLVEQRNNPCPMNDRRLYADEQICGWPWDASAEQKAEWQAIMDRTRLEYEARVNAGHTAPAALPVTGESGQDSGSGSMAAGSGQG